MTNKCVRCQISFKDYIDYHEHILTHQQNNALEAHAKHLIAHSRSTSGRTKEQIVEQAESSWLGSIIITTSNETEHLALCRCNICFQKALDNLIKTQQDSLNA